MADLRELLSRGLKHRIVLSASASHVFLALQSVILLNVQHTAVADVRKAQGDIEMRRFSQSQNSYFEADKFIASSVASVVHSAPQSLSAILSSYASFVELFGEKCLYCSRTDRLPLFNESTTSLTLPTIERTTIVII